MKLYSLNGYKHLALLRGQYVRGNLALVLRDQDDLSPYATLTVNLGTGDGLEPYQAYVDTNNLGSDIIDWIEENEIGTPTGKRKKSGFCVYPLVEFNKTLVDSLESI